MTVRKGAEWGERVARPDGLVIAASDAELAVLDSAGRELEKYKIPYGAFLYVKQGEDVK